MDEPRLKAIVDIEDLNVILAALNSAYHHSMAQDLCDNYRKLNTRRSYSAMTKALQGALNITEGYLQPPEEEEDE